MKNMIIASEDSLFLINNAIFFKRYGYNVTHANDYVHAINSIKILSETSERVGTLVVKTREFTNDDRYHLDKITKIDKNIVIVILSNQKMETHKNLQFLDYHSSPIEIIEKIK